jgi:hypothetical protein
VNNADDTVPVRAFLERQLLANAAFVLLISCVLLLWSSQSAAHGLAMDQVVLRPDFEHAELRGQVTFNPHRTRQDNLAGAARVTELVLAALRDDIHVELDGNFCPLTFEVRELWEPAGATVGDIVDVRCPLPRSTRELRVFAAAEVNALVVSIESAGADGAPGSRSVMIQGGSYTPAYRFSDQSRNWRAGGANEFLPDGGLASNRAADVAPSVAKGLAASAAPNGLGATVPPGRFAEDGLAAPFRRYLALGFHHILPLGWDHVLFVAGLVLGSGRRLRSLLWQLSAFTLAHTLTLALGALGLIVLPRGFVEPLIAFSIAYVAVENLFQRRDPRRRLLVVFAFGLLHGQGFASALSETGLPHSAFVVALLSFNVGVELGQIVVVLALSALLLPLRDPARLFRYAVRPGSLAIAAIGVVWGVQRLLPS